jgi:hypothetical protein
VFDWTVCCFLPAALWFNASVPPENAEQRKLTDMIPLCGTGALGHPVLPCFSHSLKRDHSWK